MRPWVLWGGIALAWAVILGVLLQQPPPHSVLSETAVGVLASPAESLSRLQQVRDQVGVVNPAPPDAQPRISALQWREPTPIDGAAPATLAQAQQALATGQFRTVQLPRSAGYTKQVHWLVFPVKSISPREGPWLLSVGLPFLDDVQVMVEHADGHLEFAQLGDHHLAERPLSTRLHTVLVPLQGGEEALVWLRVRSGSSMIVRVGWSTVADYFAREANFSAALGLLLGVLALGTLVYAFMGVRLRDGMMLAYAGFLGSLFILYLGQQGLIQQLLPRAPWWVSDGLVGAGTTGPYYAGCLLWAYALRLKERYPRIHTLYLGTSIFFFAAIPLGLTPHYYRLAELAFMLGPVYALLGQVLALRVWGQEKDGLYRAYLVAVCAYQTGAIVLIAAVLGWIPFNRWTEMAYPIATIVHTVVMAAALAMRMVRLRQEKLLADERATAHTELVAMLTHEFRNPLSSIDRSANFLQSLAEPAPAQLQARLGNIRHQVRRLGGLVDGFLSVGPTDTLPLSPKATTVDLHDWVPRLVQGLGSELVARVDWQVQGTGPWQVTMDPQLMSIALNNLLDNAFRYSPADAHVQLRLQRSAEGRVQLAVLDQGPGMPPEELEQLGQARRRGQASTGLQGTGLGYYFAQRIVAAQGGRLVPRSEAGQGLEVVVEWGCEGLAFVEG